MGCCVREEGRGTAHTVITDERVINMSIKMAKKEQKPKTKTRKKNTNKIKD